MGCSSVYGHLVAEPEGIVAILERLPPYGGLAWRGAAGGLIASMPLPAPLPTSRDLRFASSNFAAPVLWAIVSVAGREIGPLSANPAAQEVAILPGAMLTPATAVHEVDGVQVQVVLEVRPGAPVGDVPDDAVLAKLIREARALDPVAITQLGRFG